MKFDGHIYPSSESALEVQKLVQPYLQSITQLLWSKDAPQDVYSLDFEVRDLPLEIRHQLTDCGFNLASHE